MLMIWGGFLCLACGAYESDNDQLLHVRGKAFVHTVELLQQVKAKVSEPPSVNAPVKTVLFSIPDYTASLFASYNLRRPVSAPTETPNCCAIVFRKPEKAEISSEMFLTYRVEDMPKAGSGTPLNIDAESVIQAFDVNSLASIPSVPTIKLKSTASSQNLAPAANPVLASYHHEDISDSIRSSNNTLNCFEIRRTSPDEYLPKLNEMEIALKPVLIGDNVPSPIEIICSDNILAVASENNVHIVPIRVNAKSILDASSSIQLSVPVAPKLDVKASDNPASSLSPIILRYSANTFTLNEANTAPICLNVLKTNNFPSAQIRRIIFAPKLAKTSARSPCAMILRSPDPAIPQAIDRMLISGIKEEVHSGKINKRNPEIRAQLVQFLGDNPLGPTSQQVFSMILENFPGNALRRKIAALQAWSQEYAGGRYAPIIGYYIMHQFYRNKDYDAAIQFADSFLEKMKEFNDRVCFLQALCYAQKNNNTAALGVLHKIQHDYPESLMAPEAKFLYAWIFYEDGNLAESQSILEELVAKYPHSASAVKAGNLLEAINQKNSLAALKP